MIRLARLSVLTFVAACHAAAASAQTVPASFRDLQFLVAPGDRVTVVDTTGIQTKGRIAELDGSTLSIESGNALRLFRQDDVVVIRQRKQDSVRNGVLVGAAIGAGLGAIAELSCRARDGYCGYTGIATLGSAIWGTWIGIIADVLYRTPRDVFRKGPNAPPKSLTLAPRVARGAAGAQIAVRW